MELAIPGSINMMVCPNCGRTVPDDTMQFCPSCGFSFTQQPNQPYAPNPFGPQSYGYQGYQRKSVAIAVLLSFFFAGLGQLYVDKTKRAVSFIVTFIVLSIVSTVITTVIVKSIDYSDVSSLNSLFSNPAFLIITLVSLAFWLYNIYDAYRLAVKYNEASMRNDLARFRKEF
jgi:hypothetical protein